MTYAPALTSGFTAPPRGPMLRLKRLALMAAGALIVVAGIIIAPLPGPFGLPIALVGLAMILRNSVAAKRMFIRAQHRRPKFVYPFRRLLRKRPEFAPVMWQQMLRVERLALKGGRGALSRLRKRLRRGLEDMIPLPGLYPSTAQSTAM